MGNDKYILDEKGEPVVCNDLLEWAKWFEDNKKTVAHTNVGESRVSTVFLGLDHSFGEGPPLIYETMIFGGEHDQYQERYSTKNEAITGHERACELLKKEKL